jgi:poly-gamma-glutamate synthesis protein (capsule biosynthesis protein)
VFAPAFLLVPVLLATSPAPPSRVDLVFGGDVIPHGEVKKSAREHTQYPPEWDPTKAKKGEEPPASLNNEGWDPLLAPIAEVLRSADVGVVNLETPVTDNKNAVARAFLFNAPSGLVSALAAAGVKVVSTANNHAMDQHRKGMLETLGHLDAANILHAGTGASEAIAWEPVFLDVKGVKVGFISMTRWMNGYENPKDKAEPHVAYLPYDPKKSPGGLTVDQALEKVRAAAARCEALFVMIHWGTEYAPAPNAEDVKLGQAFLEAGAAAVIGHHPHVLQPLESYKTASGRQGLIVYSLGNLLANQSRFYQYIPGQDGKDGDTRDSMLVRVALVRREAGGPVELGEVSVVPVWIDNNAVGRVGKEPRRIQPVLLEKQLASTTELLAALEAKRAEVEAAKAKDAELRAQLPDAKVMRAMAPEEKKALQARLQEEQKVRAERVKLERALGREKAALELRLGLAKLRRERIVRMVPAGVAVVPGAPPRQESGGSAVQSAP